MRITAKRPSREQIAHDPRTSFVCFRKRSESYAYDWHAHPEVELTLIISGRGQRFVGDSVATFAPGDVVLIGPETPHTWAFDQTVTPITFPRVVLLKLIMVFVLRLLVVSGRNPQGLYRQSRAASPLDPAGFGAKGAVSHREAIPQKTCHRNPGFPGPIRSGREAAIQRDPAGLLQ